MKDTFYRSSFTREYQNFHLSKRDEPKLAGYQSAKEARCSPALVQREAASFCTQRLHAWTGYRKKIKGMLAQWIAGLTTQINVSLHPCLRG